jgi:hypothetical protein
MQLYWQCCCVLGTQLITAASLQLSSALPSNVQFTSTQPRTLHLYHTVLFTPMHFRRCRAMYRGYTNAPSKADHAVLPLLHQLQVEDALYSLVQPTPTDVAAHTQQDHALVPVLFKECAVWLSMLAGRGCAVQPGAAHLNRH